MATRVLIDENPVTTVAALNAGLADLNAASLFWIARPIVAGNSIVVAGSPLPAAGFFTNTEWFALDDDALEHDMAAVDAFMASFGGERGVQASVETRFGYHLFLVGIAYGSSAGDVLEFNYLDPGLATQDTVVTIATPDQNGTANNFVGAALMGPFTSAAGYRRSTINFAVIASQTSGFNVGQTLTTSVRIFNDANPTSITNNLPAFGTQVFPLEAGQLTQTIYVGNIDVTTSVGTGVRVLVTVGLGIAIGALENPFLLTVAATPASFGLRVT